MQFCGHFNLDKSFLINKINYKVRYMLVHTCHCIFSFVVIGFYYKRKGFQKLFENAFEILEKEKKMEIFSLLSFGPEAQLFLLSFLGLLGVWAAIPQPSCLH
jgi:hypothetical protein